MNYKKIVSSLAALTVSFASIGTATAQTATTTTSTPNNQDILDSTRNNLKNVRSVHVQGNANSTFRSTEMNPILHFLMPDNWKNRSHNVGFDFNGVIDRTATTTGTSATSGIHSSWTLSNFSPTTSVNSVSVVSHDGTVSFSAGWLFGWLTQHGLLNTTSTRPTSTGSSTTSPDWLTVNVPQFADQIGLKWYLDEKTNKVMDAINDPGSMFTATRLADGTMNGESSYHFRISANQKTLSLMFGSNTTSGTSTSNRATSTGDLWISKSNLLPNHLSFSASSTNGGSTTSTDRFSLTANFDQYNGATTTTTPSFMRTIQDLLREVFQNLSNFFARFGGSTSNPGAPTSTPATPTTTPTTTPGSTTSTTSTPTTTR